MKLDCSSYTSSILFVALFWNVLSQGMLQWTLINFIFLWSVSSFRSTTGSLKSIYRIQSYRMFLPKANDCVWGKMTVYSLSFFVPARSALCWRACSKSRTCWSSEEWLLWLLEAEGGSGSWGAPVGRHAGRDDVLMNFPVSAPPWRKLWIVCRSASCWALSFWGA